MRRPDAQKPEHAPEETAVPPSVADDVPDREARAKAHAALLRRRAAARWAGWPDDSPTVQLPAGMTIGQGGELKINGG